MDKEYDHLFKLLISGNSGVGKSCIMDRFVDDTFNTTWIATIGVDFKIRTINIGGLRIKLQIWDTSGQERFKTIVSSYYTGSHGFILVFDVTDAESFQALSSWINDIDRHAPERRTSIVVGNKSDLEAQRQVTFEEGRSFAEKNGMSYIEVSAARNHNIQQCFELLSRELVSKLI